MASQQKRLLFLLFFLSGFCGLLYQVVWVRMSFASFGVITPVLSVVISVFMFGLFAGSWLAGRLVGPLTRRLGVSAIWLYALAELAIGLGAFAVPQLFSLGETALLPVGGTDSAAYLFWSALIIAGAIFPWCLFMGATFPLMMAYVKDASGESTSFSFLYLANVIGAMTGTLITAVVLVELLGFRDTLLVAAAANLFIAVTAGTLGLRHPHSGGMSPAEDVGFRKPVSREPARSTAGKLAAVILFTTGFTSMAMEVVWTRAFTVVLQTQVYSFAMLLFVYLLATWIGSLRYRRDLATRDIVPTARLIAWLALTSLLPLVVNDPRLELRWAGALLSIFPFCALLGYLTPKLIDEYSAGDPDRAGYSYALNILGCILGPLVASYWMLPTLGLKGSLLLLAAPYLALFLLGEGRALATHRRVAYWTAALLFLAVVVNRTYEDQVQGFRGRNGVVRRDHTATVISYGEGMGKRLLVNGIGITHLTPITKVMAHLPLSLVEHKPTSALVICFGMGTTFRSLMSWGLNATAVELVPSVKEAFPYYFADAKEIVSRPNGKIVIDDGRRYLRRTSEMFDVITLDPPPPVEAAGSSLLYSEEFYSAVKERLKPGGILQQWIPDAEDRIVQAVVHSLTNSFPYVKMYRSFEGWGHHFLASMSPIHVPPAAELARRMPPAAKADLVEWRDDKNVKGFLELILSQERDPRTFQRGKETVTDDRPFNEYYLMRRALHGTTGAG